MDPRSRLTAGLLNVREVERCEVRSARAEWEDARDGVADWRDEPRDDDAPCVIEREERSEEYDEREGAEPCDCRVLDPPREYEDERPTDPPREPPDEREDECEDAKPREPDELTAPEPEDPEPREERSAAVASPPSVVARNAAINSKIAMAEMRNLFMVLVLSAYARDSPPFAPGSRRPLAPREP